jgi:alpha-glucosidase
MRKTICAILMGSCALAYANAQTLFPVTSPDGSISLVLKLKEKGLYYEVEKNGVKVLVESPVRLTIDESELCNSVDVLSSDTYKTDNTYPIRGSHSLAVDRSNGQIIKLRNSSLKTDFSLEARAYNDGVAFRMILPGKQGEIRTPDEHTLFTLPVGSTVWHHDMYCHYEGIHRRKDISEIMQGEWAAPPVTGNCRENPVIFA